MEICFATNNKNKLKEIKLAVQGIDILGLEEIGCSEELPENQTTLAGNSLEKASFVFDHYKANCFADDTGLEVEAYDKLAAAKKGNAMAGIRDYIQELITRSRTS